MSRRGKLIFVCFLIGAACALFQTRCGKPANAAPAKLPVAANADAAGRKYPSCLPANLYALEELRPLLEKMWRRSPTFRRQCERIAQRPGMKVSLRVTLRPIAILSSRALTKIRKAADGSTIAEIRIFNLGEMVELIGHEFEHILEYLDGFDLRSPAARRQLSAHLTADSPNQINYLMPSGLANGVATVTVANGQGSRVESQTEISAVAPGLFSANSSGAGAAAAVALRIRANGAQVYEPVARYDAQTQKFVLLPIDLSNSAEQVYLILFGTGIRHRGALKDVTIKVGETELPVAYAGEASGSAGLDQVNVLAPVSLRGRGEQTVTLRVNGKRQVGNNRRLPAPRRVKEKTVAGVAEPSHVGRSQNADFFSGSNIQVTSATSLLEQLRK